MVKLDLVKELKDYYSSSVKHVVLVNVPEMQFLMVDGKGDPNTSREFQAAIEALYSLSYTLKFMVKKGRTAIDFKVMPLEGLWWVNDMATFSVEAKEDWSWTLMIMQPELVTQDLYKEALEQVKKKKENALLTQVRLENYHEGMSVQTLHIGPFSEEGPTVARLHQFASDQGYTLRDKHHEIYLSDPRRSAPEKWRTIIRQPVQLRLPRDHDKTQV